ncbi:cytochrome o ubiquinol oxidase subunit III [Stappia sp. BW2]|jgi:cytochrome o ubiquinol oxidase subunit 3|uniref:cytochrome c oxidase subunit 3 n=1 Tax=Stappia sp. BW2 TaxID=2592622 RepID=UPI0011DE9F7A|nr:cytochrome c oxidase subunit 3 [Stappia sp. BW2]TYC64059.1 cytochrome o ubiquinol oxidase subunit III [Stappia sp. BW2]
MTTSNTNLRRHPGLNLGPSHGKAHEEAESVVFGFWVFLMSDLVTFAMFFAIYATSIQATAGGPGNADIVDVTSIALQTGSLLISSLLFGVATVAMKYHSSKRVVILWLLASLAFGLCFLGLEIRDFIDAAEKGAVPMRSSYLSSYWALVGLHGLHVSVGSLMILVVCVQIAFFGFASDVKTRVLRLGLYWHFLDIIWIGIFSVVFLPGLLS